MCGIVGVVSERGDAATLAATALLALQNRGKQSTGLFGYDDRSRQFPLQLRRAAPASDVYDDAFFRDAAKRRLPMAIGHNRYATSGDSVERDIQPLRITKPGIAAAHNGQVANLITLERRLRDQGWSMDTACDVELLLGALGQSLDDHRATTHDTAAFIERRLRPALLEIMDPQARLYVNGAYSLVAIIDGVGLLGVRDPHGIRPMVFGTMRHGDGVAHVLASERAAFHQLGEEWLDRSDVQPGEAILIDAAQQVHRFTVREAEHAHCAFEYPYFANVTSKVEGIGVYDARLRLGRMLAEEHPDAAGRLDIIMPLPESPRPIALAMAEALGIPPAEGVIKNPHYTRRVFQEPTPELRQAGLSRKYLFIKSQIEGKRVGIVDDSIVRGDTSARIVANLRRLGAASVEFYIAFPAITHPCPYGIDIPDPSELVARGKRAEEVAQAIGADRVAYISDAGFARAIGLQGLCMACTNGRYITGDGVTEYTERRLCERVRA